MVQTGDVNSIMLLFVGVFEKHLFVKLGTIPIAVGQLHSTNEELTFLSRFD